MNSSMGVRSKTWKGHPFRPNPEKNSKYSRYLKGPWKNYVSHTLFLLFFFINESLIRLIWLCSGDKIFGDKTLTKIFGIKFGECSLFNLFFFYKKTLRPFLTWIYGLYRNMSHKVRVILQHKAGGVRCEPATFWLWSRCANHLTESLDCQPSS